MGTARTAAEYVAEGILGGPFSETYERDLLEAQVKAVC